MDMECYDCVSPDEQSPVGVEELEKAISDINWRCGHSGQLHSEEDAEILNDLWRKTFEKE